MDAGFVALVVRSVVSLAVVLAVIAVVYTIAKRRANGGTTRAFVRPASKSASRRAPAALETIARVGLSRGSAAVAVRFADQVVLLGVTEGSPVTVLREIPAAHWDELSEVEQVVATPVAVDGVDRDLGAMTRPGFIEALREVTSRRV